MMKYLSIVLLFSGLLLFSGCGSNGNGNGELPPPEEFDWPWLKTGQTLDLPELEDAVDLRGGPETNMISVKAGTDKPYHFSTANEQGEMMERPFELRELRAVLRDAREHHDVSEYHSVQIMIAAEKNVTGRVISDLIGAFSHINYNRFNFQTAYPEGFEADEQFYDRIPHLSMVFPPIDKNGFFAHRREQGADFYLTREEIAALKKPKKEKKANPLGSSPDDINIEDLPPPPSMDPEDIPPPPPPPPPPASIRFSLVYPGSSAEKREGALYVKLIDGTTLEVGGKQVPLREYSKVLKDLFPDIKSAPPVVMSFAPEVAWDNVVEMLRVMRNLNVRKYALHTPEHDAFIEYLIAHPELSEETEAIWD